MHTGVMPLFPVSPMSWHGIMTRVLCMHKNAIRCRRKYCCPAECKSIDKGHSGCICTKSCHFVTSSLYHFITLSLFFARSKTRRSEHIQDLRDGRDGVGVEQALRGTIMQLAERYAPKLNVAIIRQDLILGHIALAVEAHGERAIGV